MKNTQVFKLFSVLLLAVMLVTACTPAATPTAAPVATEAPKATEAPAATSAPAEAAKPTEASKPAGAADLKITGKVAQEQSWAEADVKAMQTMEVEAANKNGAMSKYTGVSLKSLLELAKPASDATTLTFVASDGFTAEMKLADAVACEKCIVSFRDKGGFSMVMPDMDKNLSVKGVVELQVK